MLNKLRYCLISGQHLGIAYSMSARVSNFESILHRFRCNFCDDHDAYFCCGQENLLGGQFWVMGRFNLLGGQSNLLGGQMSTQLTCY